MTKKPFYNALTASAYIVLLVSSVFYGSQFVGNESSIIFPIGFLSLFVFSAAFMAFVFFYQPVMLFLDGQKKEGVDLFLKTVASFAGITIAIVISWFVLSKVL